MTPEQRQRKLEANRARYYARKKAGLCYACAQPTQRLRVRCEPCEARTRAEYGVPPEYFRDRRQRLASAGLCTGCGEAPPDEGFRSCARCRLRNAEARRASWRRRRGAKPKQRCAFCGIVGHRAVTCPVAHAAEVAR